MPGAAIIWEPFRLGPFDLRIKQREDGGNITAAEGLVETTNNRNGSAHDSASGNFGEVTKPKHLDDLRLYWCGVRVHSISPKGDADHGAFWSGPFGLCHETCNGLGNVMRIWRVSGLERRHEMLEHDTRNPTNCAIGCHSAGICRLLNTCIHLCGMGARLDERHFDAELRHLVTEAISERFDCEFAGAIDAEKREGDAPEDRADIYDQPVSLSAHGRQHRT